MLGLKEGGVDWAYDQYNDKLITPDIKAKLEEMGNFVIANSSDDYASLMKKTSALFEKVIRDGGIKAED